MKPLPGLAFTEFFLPCGGFSGARSQARGQGWIARDYFFALLFIGVDSMKLTLVAASAVLSVLFAGATFADDSADSTKASGASDSTVVTQTHDTHAEKKQAQPTTKGGRPLDNSKATR
jgi:hypothetical protein